ncbi:uncharacterized protein [Anabrus simplex]|uniref:uncharacterized protein isoform X2 n=1 Tax=Anabrus simplex TaxID=316456 RepID=UPI0034DCD72A
MAAVHTDAAVFGYTAFSQDVPVPTIERINMSDSENRNNFNPQDLCPCSRDDFIIFAEFSEVTGPIPLLTIPANLEESMDIDVGNLIMKIMSVDYQANPSGQFSFCQDVEVLQTDIAPSTYAYVHYCTLHDLKARGFVRPLCLAYMSADVQKLHSIFPLLRERFLKATSFLKYNNQQWFMEEILKVLANLKIIQNRFFSLKKKEDDGMVLTDEEQKLVSDTKMDQLVHQYSEHKHMLHTVEPLLVDDRKRDFLNEWKLALMGAEGINYQIEPYLSKLRQESRSKSGRDSLRSVISLSPWGLAAAIWELLNILRTYSHCRLEKPLDMFPLKPAPSTNESEFVVQKALADPEFVRLLINMVHPFDMATDKNFQECARSQECLTQDSLEYLESTWLTSGNEASSSYHSVPESLSDLLILEPDRPPRPPQWSDASSESSNRSASNESFLDISETDSWVDEAGELDGEVHRWIGCVWSCGKPPVRNLAGHKILKFFQTFPKAAHHVLYSLLIGRTVVIAGSEQMEHKVGNMITALIPLVPVSDTHVVKTLRWHRGILVSSHIASYQLIGMCIPERLSVLDMISPRDKNLVTVFDVSSKQLFGPAYSGQLLSSVETVASRLPSDQSLLLYLQSVAAGVHEKLFLYRALGHSQPDLHGCDGEIIKFLTKIKLPALES